MIVPARRSVHSALPLNCRMNRSCVKPVLSVISRVQLLTSSPSSVTTSSNQSPPLPLTRPQNVSELRLSRNPASSTALYSLRINGFAAHRWPPRR